MKIKLLQKQIDFLSKLPEQGMGYQIVDLILGNGRVLKEKRVFNSTYLELNEDDVIMPEDIIEITLSGSH